MDDKDILMNKVLKWTKIVPKVQKQSSFLSWILNSLKMVDDHIFIICSVKIHVKSHWDCLIIIKLRSFNKKGGGP